MNLATKKWIFTKASSVILLPLMIWFILSFVSIYDQGYSEILNFFMYFIHNVRISRAPEPPYPVQSSGLFPRIASI